MKPPPTLLLIDAMALLYRAHFAFAGRTQSKGSTPLYGFANSLLKAVKSNPTHVIVAMDSQGPTFRNALYAAYKEGREAQPEAITEAIKALPQLLDAFHIPSVALPGYEADDLIGTLAKQAAAQGYQIHILTPDKDFAQLVGPQIHLYKPSIKSKPMVHCDTAAVCRDWGVANPLQVIDLLALWGDTSDNIPGVKGIGIKGAQKLIAQYGSIEKIYAAIETIEPPRIQTLLKEGKALAFCSKKLATICQEAPLHFDLATSQWAGLDRKALQQCFQQFGFRQLSKRIAAGSSTHGQQLSLFADKKAVVKKKRAFVLHHLTDLAAWEKMQRAVLKANNLGVHFFQPTQQDQACLLLATDTTNIYKLTFGTAYI